MGDLQVVKIIKRRLRSLNFKKLEIYSFLHKLVFFTFFYSKVI